MTELFEKRAGPSYRCPVCDVMLAAEPALPAYDAPCPDCGYRLWCRKRKVGDVVVLSVLPDRTPEHSELERLAESFLRRRDVLRVVVDLRRRVRRASRSTRVNNVFFRNWHRSCRSDVPWAICTNRGQMRIP